MDTPLFGNSHLPAELDARVRSELREGEQLLWVGQPRPGRFARQAIPIVIFGILWTGGFIFFEFPPLGLVNGNPFSILDLFFLILSMPFLAAGLAMLGSPFWFAHRARRTCYAITDQRAILREAGWFGGIAVYSYEPAKLAQLRRVDSSQGVGDLVFEEIKVGSDGDIPQPRGFLAIDRVREIEELLRKTLRLGEAPIPNQDEAMPPESDY